MNGPSGFDSQALPPPVASVSVEPGPPVGQPQLDLSIDNMRAYNEKYGQVAGNGILKHVAPELGGVAHRGGDMVTRTLGTRFAAILPDTSKEGTPAVASCFRASIETANSIRAADELVVSGRSTLIEQAGVVNA